MDRRLRQTDEPRKLAELLAILFADSAKTRLDFVFTREDVSVPIGKNIHVHVHYTDGVVCDPEASYSKVGWNGGSGGFTIGLRNS